jgi:hypothetical protein
MGCNQSFLQLKPQFFLQESLSSNQPIQHFLTVSIRHLTMKVFLWGNREDTCLRIWALRDR